MKLLDHRAAKWLIAGFISVSAGVNAEVLFEESFDKQPDWTSAMYSTENNQDYLNYKLPDNWHMIRQTPNWAPSTGHPDRHEVMEITSGTISENPNRARGGTGKSFVTWRDSYDPGWKKWNSDGIMFYRLPGDGVRSIYIEYWINFSDETIATFYKDGLGQSKILRVMSHDFPDDFSRRSTGYFSFFESNHKPMYIWGIDGGLKYGIRNKISIYREKTSQMSLNDYVVNFPREFGRIDDNSLSYSKSMTEGQSVGGGDPQLTDYKNNGVIGEGPVYMDQVFGDETVWVKFGHYIEMNSAPGVPDGKLYQYVNDKRILQGEGIEWQTSAQPADKLWNLVGIGGNDYFHAYPNSERHEEWYAIDDLVIRTDLPAQLKSQSSVNPPNPPSTIAVE